MKAYDGAFLCGLVLYGSFPETISDGRALLDMLRRAAVAKSFDVIEIPFTHEKTCWPAIRETAEEHHIPLLASAGPVSVREKLSLCHQNPDVVDATIKRLKEAIDFAYAVRARSLLIMSGVASVLADERASAEALEQSLVEIDSYAMAGAVDYRLRLSLEPTDINIHHRQFLGPSERVIRFFSRPRVRELAVDVTLDMSHIPQLGEEIEGATRMLGAAVGHAHIANAVLLQEHPLYGDMHPPFGTAGGHYAAADIGHFLDALGGNCFSEREEFSCGRPVVSLEIRPYPAGQTAERVLSEAAQLADAVRASRRRG